MAGVRSVNVDLDRKQVTVEGDPVHEESVRAAIDDAGYEIAGPAGSPSDGSRR